MKFSMTQYAILVLLGGVGAAARFALAGVVQRLFGSGFPAGTLVVNVLGCFLFGVVWTLADERLLVRSETRLLILVGFMGSFTTFSTFAFETTAMLRDSQWLLATGNLLAHNLIGILALIVGVSLGRLI